MKKPVIQFEHFNFKYRTQVDPTLHDINLTIYEGEKVLIVGPSGSGKSTIGHCLNGLIPFSYKGEITGSLKIMGQETKDLDIFSLSKMAGTVLQDPDGQFIGLTVAEDIAFALENDVKNQDEMFSIVKEVSTMVDIDGHLQSSLHQLSGGQKQRVSLAGVMVDDVDILLFDEPLANLDPATGKHAIHLIDRIQKETNTTVVIIEHRLEDVLECQVDRIVVVDKGRIVADLTPNELLASSILEECNIREPLYVKAAKYAGSDVTAESKPSHIDTFTIDRDKLHTWFEATNPPERKKKAEPILELESIHFSYLPGREIIHNVSFSIEKGEMVSIAGKNGAGKSTLASLICGFVKPNSGRILFNSKDITNDTIKERAERIGLVMQNPNQMISKHMIFDEVALGLVLRGVSETEIKERVEKTLRICGLFPFRNWPISALSFGQKKRVTIASILVLEPDLIILDEPTAGQDFKHYTEIMEFLTELNEQGITILMITHDMHLMLEYTPRAIVIAGGKKIADDTSANILTDSVVIEKANLKETSLFDLAVKAGIKEPREFVGRFIAFDKEVRTSWQ
ncbi:ABC transporter ATP-binding protein [Lederbergia wuyishanensis]|uniref:Energy-coupling factor transport system ATP-binding protein n=1 Tax=Lederbergia wuyishanensis TaxID=1347903 RepID=A0ABU0D9I1_9BACI|nr:ABC transporter ATP-binding protein [Lederbergia wuyishanensis]MCJ8007469.1 ABC transporter ATP-binding protein [Lederbergia wuyishanensis]MDQ0345092.1 energy-coupling factor transport system ATP-binding protein [Lederbergia wuyishanensis]